MGRRVGMTPSELHVANLSLPGPPLIIRGKKKVRNFIPRASQRRVKPKSLLISQNPFSVQIAEYAKFSPAPAQTTKPNQQLLTETAATPQLSPNSKRTIKTLKTTL